MNVAEALITLGWFVGMVTLAVAVDAARVPARAVLVAELAAPFNGFTVTVTAVPKGMLDAPRPIVIGLGVLAGIMMSGFTKEPVGEGGAANVAFSRALRRVGCKAMLCLALLLGRTRSVYV